MSPHRGSSQGAPGDINRFNAAKLIGINANLMVIYIFLKNNAKLGCHMWFNCVQSVTHAR
jgi:hypothetical protein